MAYRSTSPRPSPGRSTRQMMSQFSLHGETIEEVDQFPHLGSIVSKDGGTDQDIKARIRKATAALRILHPIWRSRVISCKTKLRIFNTSVKSVLLYACETWRTTKASTNRLQTFVNRCLRNILNIRWEDRVSNEDLWQRTGQERIEVQIMRRKWGWLGHTLRKPASNIARHALRWNPQGKRRPGRPRNTWRRSTEAEARTIGLNWTEMETAAKDQWKWRAMVDDLCFSKG